MVLHLLLPGIHVQLKNSLQVYTKRPWTLAHEDFLLSLEYFSAAALLYSIAVVVGYIEGREVILRPVRILVFSYKFYISVYIRKWIGKNPGYGNFLIDVEQESALHLLRILKRKENYLKKNKQKNVPKKGQKHFMIVLLDFTKVVN